MRATITVLVVDDSALIRQMLTRALELDPRVRVVGIAKTGVEAIEKARELQPDVITLDIEMPELSGIEALPHLRKHSDARVIVLSSIDDPDTTYQALSAGAVDFIVKPRTGFATSLSELSELLLKKIHIAYRIDARHVEQAITELEKPAEEPVAPAQPAPPTGTLAADRAPEYAVALGASTGGPPALERVLKGLVPAMPAAYLIVQHLPAGFSASLARRLSSAGEIHVVEAAEGMRITAGTGYLAPHGAHMTVVEPSRGTYRIHLDDSAPLHGVRPAVDPLFSSVARVFGDRAVGVLLSGMGSDGANGLADVHAAGGATIAQNEETSVVWGMPGAAHKRGVVQRLAPITLVAAEVRRAVRGSGAA